MEYMAILECLERKKQLFDEYENCTSQMCVCEVDDLEKYITKRAALAIEIDKISGEIDSFCEMAGDVDLVRDAVQNHGDYGDFPRELQYVYDEASKIFTVIGHVHNLESQVKQRMTNERASYLEKIKQGAGAAKMYGYVRNLQGSPQQNMFLGEQKV